MKTLKSIEQVVQSGLCIGCGLCAVVAPETWKLNTEGPMPLPVRIGADDGRGIYVCPAVHGTRTLCAESAATFPDLQQITRMGPLRTALVGHSMTSQRANSSSGGMLTEYLSEILDQGLVDAVVHVAQKTGGGFEYVKSKSSAEVRASCKTRYFPVDLHKLAEFVSGESKVALVANPCFTAAVRRLSLSAPESFGSIQHFVSFFCGHWKSKSWTEYLVACSKPSTGNLIDYRTKIADRPASKYGYQVEINQQIETNLMSDVPNGGWQFGLFKPLLCDFCDDVGAEMADVVFGDAWLKPESEDALGTSVVLVRSATALATLQSAATKGHVSFTELPVERLLESQNATLRHRQGGISARIALRKISRKFVPPARVKPSLTPTRTNLVSLARYRLSKRSNVIWMESRKLSDPVTHFNKRLKFDYFLIRLASRIPTRRKI